MILNHINGLNYHVWDDDGTLLGYFTIEHYNARVSSIHSHLYPSNRGKGYGTQMYDEAEKLLNNLNRILVPSPSLSRYSLRFWQKRAPHLLRFHTLLSYNDGLDMPTRSLYSKLDPTPRWMFWRKGWWYQWRKEYWPC